MNIRYPQVSDRCAAHVKRVMHQRATDIRLMPEIEIPCLSDLGKLCSDSRQQGEVFKQKLEFSFSLLSQYRLLRNVLSMSVAQC